VSLQRLVLTFDGDTVTVRTLYHTKAVHGPGMKARTRQASPLVAGRRARVKEPIHAPEQGGDK
jgi:hypothetical protein